jgi:predicted ATP-grasp superfamily ATP-dependent carboligase
MVLVRCERELLHAWRTAREAGLEVVLQEYVPGPDSAVVNYNAYTWGDGPGVEFTARQLRKAPPRFGSPRVAVSEHIDEVLEPGRRMLRALGFEGFACTEFKRDARDGRYKVLDVNGRHNLSGLLAVRCGIDFPLLQYRHLMYGEPPQPRDFRTGVFWTDFFRDAGYGVRFLLEERASPWAYLAPYLGPRCDAVFDRSDLRPFLARLRWLASSARKRLRRNAADAKRRGGPALAAGSCARAWPHATGDAEAQIPTPTAAATVSRR